VRRGSRHGSRARLPGLLAAGLFALSAGPGCGEPEPPILAPVEGDVYRIRLFGLEVEKPGDWYFLPHSSLKQDTDARIEEDLAAMWERLHRPSLVPLVGMGPKPGEEDPRASPVFGVHAVPLRPGDKSDLIFHFLNAPPEAVLATRSGKHAHQPGFQVLEEARPLELAGQPAAVMRLTYRLGGEEGPEVALEELSWFFRRGKVFVYLIGTGPAPLPPEVVERFERIAHSIRLDS